MRAVPLTPLNGTAANPKRRFKKKTYVMDGQPILMVLSDGNLTHQLGAGVTVEGIHDAVKNIKRCRTGVAMFRMCGVVFDVAHTIFPTVDQQFKALQHYADNQKNLLFDGWRDVIVQKIDPQGSQASVNQKPCIGECLKHLHFTHVAFTSLAFTSDEDAIPRLIAGLGVRGRTVAILDQGIDTLTYPDQLGGLAPLYSTLETVLMNRMQNMLKSNDHRFGWEKVAGRFIPNTAPRDRYRKFVQLVDRRFGKSDPIPLKEYRDIYREARSKARSVPFGRLYLDAVYLLTQLNFPLDGCLNTAKVIVDHTGYRRSLGRPIDYEHARSLVASAAHGEGSIQEELALRYASIFQKAILERCQQGYIPDYAHPSVIHGCEEGEQRESVSAKHGKRFVFRDVARTALGIVEASKETRTNCVVRELMRKHFIRLIEQANDGIVEHSKSFSMPRPLTHDMVLYRDIAKSEDAMRSFSLFAKHKQEAEAHFEALVSQYPEWSQTLFGSWGGFLQESMDKAKSVAGDYAKELRLGEEALIAEPDPEKVAEAIELPDHYFDE